MVNHGEGRALGDIHSRYHVDRGGRLEGLFRGPGPGNDDRIQLEGLRDERRVRRRRSASGHYHVVDSHGREPDCRHQHRVGPRRQSSQPVGAARPRHRAPNPLPRGARDRDHGIGNCGPGFPVGHQTGDRSGLGRERHRANHHAGHEEDKCPDARAHEHHLFQSEAGGIRTGLRIAQSILAPRNCIVKLTRPGAGLPVQERARTADGIPVEALPFPWPGPDPPSGEC